MRLLDLFCGAGGSAVGYRRAGFDEIVGVDNRPMPRYPFTFVLADALEYCAAHGREFDAIHASPPCQRYSNIQKINKNAHTKPDLLADTRQLLMNTGVSWVIENVEEAPMRIDVMLCGSFFGLGMIRHRIFELSFPIPFSLFPACSHTGMYDPWHYGTRQKEEMADGMGIDWSMTRNEVREAIPPAYTTFIGRFLLDAIRDKK